MFKDQVAVITGAGSGIGRALALQLAAKGARLALSDINEVTLKETMTLLPDACDAKSYIVDVSSREQVYANAAEVKHEFGRVDYVINNAGTGIIASVEHFTLEEIEKVISINLWGTIYGTKAYLPYMLKQKSGRIVNISSVFGLIATPCQAAYTMSKFAVRGLTETLWHELEGTGVEAILVHPGGIDTNIKQAPRAVNETDYEREIMKGFTSQMITTPDDCAKEIIDGLIKGDKRLLVGNGAKAIYWLSRIFPNSYGEKMKKKHGL